MEDFVGEGFIPPVQFLAAANAPGGMNASPTNFPARAHFPFG